MSISKLNSSNSSGMSCIHDEKKAKGKRSRSFSPELPLEASSEKASRVYEETSSSSSSSNSGESSTAKEGAEIPLNDNLFHPREKRLLSDLELVRKKLAKERVAAAIQQRKQQDQPKFRTVLSKGTHKFFSFTKKVNSRLIGVAHDQGRRETMEDEDLISSGRVNNLDYELFAIFDGHSGDLTAKFLKNNLENFVVAELAKLKEANELEIFNALKTACILCDAKIKEQTFKPKSTTPSSGSRAPSSSGSTAIIALQFHNSDLWIANVGDSRAVWRKENGETVQLSEDQKPENPKYEKSINKRGGQIFRIDHGRRTARINKRINIARSFNDNHLRSEDKKTYCISARPKIVQVRKDEIEKGDILILTCDGIFEKASANDVGQRAADHYHPSSGTKRHYSPAEEAARQIVGASFGSGGTDNLSAMVIPLR